MEDVGPCRNGFEGKLSALSQFQTDEANALMTRALTAMDMMNNAIELQNEVNLEAGAMLGEQVCLEVASSVASDQRCPPDMIDNAIDRHPGWLCISAVGLGDAVSQQQACIQDMMLYVMQPQGNRSCSMSVSFWEGGRLQPRAPHSSGVHVCPSTGSFQCNQNLRYMAFGLPGTSLPTAAILHARTAPS